MALARIPLPDVPVIDRATGLITTDWFDALKRLEGNVTTVATLPAVGNKGARGFVTDATSTTFASAVAGGGANNVPVYDDGTIWRIG